MNDLNTKLLFSKDDIAKRVQELGKQISQDYNQEPILVIGVLKGSVLFMSDLIRAITGPVQIDFIGVSSYEGVSSTGNVRITHDLKADIANKHILLVEDIIDTGLTIDYLKNLLQLSKPKSLKVCTLLSKPEAHEMNHAIDYIGFDISKEFVIGYGLDLDGLYRNIPEILQVIPD